MSFVYLPIGKCLNCFSVIWFISFAEVQGSCLYQWNRLVLTNAPQFPHLSGLNNLSSNLHLNIIVVNDRNFCETMCLFISQYLLCCSFYCLRAV